MTNQIAVKFTSDTGAAHGADPDHTTPTPSPILQPTSDIRTQVGSVAVAALGNTWSHSVNSRLLLEFVAGVTYRRLRIAKSPLVGGAVVHYAIGDAGPIPVDAAAPPGVRADLAPADAHDLAVYDDDVAVGLYDGTALARARPATAAAPGVDDLDDVLWAAFDDVGDAGWPAPP